MRSQYGRICKYMYKKKYPFGGSMNLGFQCFQMEKNSIWTDSCGHLCYFTLLKEILLLDPPVLWLLPTYVRLVPLYALGYMIVLLHGKPLYLHVLWLWKSILTSNSLWTKATYRCPTSYIYISLNDECQIWM